MQAQVQKDTSWITEEEETASAAGPQSSSRDLWKSYHDLLLKAVLKKQEEEKAEFGFVRERSESERSAELYEILKKLKDEIPETAQERLVREYLNDAYRMGPLQELWDKKMVSDIQAFIPLDDGNKQFVTYMERGERKVWQGDGFRDFNHARDWLNRHLSRLNLHYDPAKVELNGTFPQGERIHVISGNCGYSIFEQKIVGGVKIKNYKFVRCLIMSFRRNVFSFSVEDLTDKSTPDSEIPSFEGLKTDHGAITWKRRTAYTKFTGGMACQATMDWLRILVMMGKSHIIAGSTGIGKTTLANSFTAFIPELDVLLVLEESLEMQPQCSTPVIRIFQKDEIFDLASGLKSSLRMFPKRIFVAELRDDIAYVFLQAIRSGHDGSATTVHASDCMAAITRVIDMAAAHPSRPDRNGIRQDLYERVTAIFHGRMEGQTRFFDEAVELKADCTEHKVMEFVEVSQDSKGNPIGYWAFYGPSDEFVKQMKQKNIPIPASWMWEEEEVLTQAC